MLYEAIDYRDPCAILMSMEGDDDEAEASESFWVSGGAVRRVERERRIDGTDMRGASPAELAALEFSVDDN